MKKLYLALLLMAAGCDSNLEQQPAYNTGAVAVQLIAVHGTRNVRIYTYRGCEYISISSGTGGALAAVVDQPATCKAGKDLTGATGG